MRSTLGRNRAPRPLDRYVGSRIRMRRTMLRISQESLGAAIGVSFQQIQKYEKGTNRVGAGRLQDIAEALGCQPAWFFEGRPGPAGKDSAATRRIDADISAFIADKYAPFVIRGFVRLPPRVKRAIASVIVMAAGQREEASADRAPLRRARPQ